MKKNIVRPLVLLTLCCLIFMLSSCGKDCNEYSSFAMGSLVSAKLYGESEETDEIWENIAQSINEADSLLSASVSNSDISLLNKNGRVKADDYTVSVLTDALRICNICSGKIDITLGAVTELWGFSGDNPSLPSAEDIENALTLKDLDGIVIDNETNVITVKDNQHIDLGAFGKGAACDKACQILHLQNVPAVLSFGGTVLLFGENPSGESWSVGIRNPQSDAGDWFATLKIDYATTDNPVFISTSGNYEKTFEENGKTYHHILDPETGYPVENNLVGVTVISSSGLNSDALSTACFVNGANEETLEWLSYFDAEAVFVFEDLSVYATDGIKDSLTIETEGFTLKDNL